MKGYKDLREFISLVEERNLLRHIHGANPHLEIGGITAVAAELPECPALLFDHIVGYPSGFRIFSNPINTPQRAALALRVDPKLRPVEMLQAWMKKRRNLKHYPPVMTSDAAFLENTDEGDAVDLRKFPVPRWHRGDGGPYIGSGSVVVTRDPDSGWVNASIYRVQVHGRRRVTVQFDHEGRHGAIITKKYFDRGRPCPIAIVNGEDPALFIAGYEMLPLGYSEFEFAGSIKDTPVELCAGPKTGLPIPAHAEIILEGVLNPTDERLMEGPFGEYTGYYASGSRPLPIVEVEAIHYRNNPILLGSPPQKPPRQSSGLPSRAGAIWASLESSGITDVVGVWQHVSSMMTVVSLKQRYDGHAKRAGLVAAAHTYMGRIVVVVDEDIDPSNLNDVMWAITTRSEPSETVDIINNGWSSLLDPRIPPWQKESGVTSHSKMIINACRPFSWIKQFPRATTLSADERREIEVNWLGAIIGRGDAS